MHTQLQFDNRFLEELPGDSEPDNFVREVRGACYSRVQPTPVRSPIMVAFSPETADLLGLDKADCATDTFLQVFTGNKLLPGMDRSRCVTGVINLGIGPVNSAMGVRSILVMW